MGCALAENLRCSFHQVIGWQMTQGNKPIPLRPPIVRSRFLEVICFAAGGLCFMLSGIFVSYAFFRGMFDWRELLEILAIFWTISAIWIGVGYFFQRRRETEASSLKDYNERMAALFGSIET